MPDIEEDIDLCPDIESCNLITTFKKEIFNANANFEHYMDENEKVFFVDVPHLFKCVRNHIFNLKDVQVIIDSHYNYNPLYIFVNACLVISLKDSL